MQTFPASHGAVCQARTNKASEDKLIQGRTELLQGSDCKFPTLRKPHLTVIDQSQEVQLVVQSVGDVPRVHIPSDDGSRHVKRTPWPQDGRQVGNPNHRLIPADKQRQS
jgi:hypothetical protein